MKLIKKIAITTALVASTATAATGDTGKLEAGMTICNSQADAMTYREALQSGNVYKVKAIYKTNDCMIIPDGSEAHYRVLSSELFGNYSAIIAGPSLDELGVVYFVTNESIGVK
jgi:hypothetical protein